METLRQLHEKLSDWWVRSQQLPMDESAVAITIIVIGVYLVRWKPKKKTSH